jgi:hypothetical protein
MGGGRKQVVLVNMLRSGRSASLGGGGLCGALAYLAAGSNISGKMTSSLDAVGELGVDIDFCIVWSGSRMM